MFTSARPTPNNDSKHLLMHKIVNAHKYVIKEPHAEILYLLPLFLYTIPFV